MANSVVYPWFANAQDFDEVKALIVDSNGLPASYAAWTAIAKRFEDMTRRQGHGVFKAYVIPAAFRDFLRTSGREPNYEALNAFAVSLLP